MRYLSLIILFMIGFGSQAEVENKNFVLCRHFKDIRTIRVDFSNDEGKCQTTYTKLGKDKIVGNGRHVQSCTRILDNIKGNLEGANWKCKSVSNASFSEGSEQAVE